MLLIWVSVFVFFSMFLFSFCLVRWVVLFPPCPHTPFLFMKLENLKDCCVFVNNKTIVHSVLVNVPCPNCYFWSPSPRGCGLFLMSTPHPHPGVNVWDQTLLWGVAKSL